MTIPENKRLFIIRTYKLALLFLPVMLFNGGLTLFVSAQSNNSKPLPELHKLEILVGDWTYEGKQENSSLSDNPYGQEGKFSGKITTRFLLNGHFLESKLVEKNPAGDLEAIEIFEYSNSKKQYQYNTFLSDGGRADGTFIINGNTITYRSTMTTQDGETSMIKSIQNISPDRNSITTTCYLSVDDGKSWTLWSRYTSKKVK